MAVSGPEPKVLAASEEEFAVEHEVAEEIVEELVAPVGRHLSEEHVFHRIGIVVEHIPPLQVAINDGEAEGQVTESFRNTELDLKGDVFPVTRPVGGQLTANVFEEQGSRKLPGRIVEYAREVGGPPLRKMTFPERG